MRHYPVQIKGFIFILVFGLLYVSSHADFLFSTGEAFTLGSTTYNSYNIISTNGTGAYTTIQSSLSAVFPPESNIVTFQFFSTNTVVFSLGEDAVIQGTRFTNKDLIVWNGTTATLLWSGLSNGLPPGNQSRCRQYNFTEPITIFFFIR